MQHAMGAPYAAVEYRPLTTRYMRGILVLYAVTNVLLGLGHLEVDYLWGGGWWSLLFFAAALACVAAWLNPLSNRCVAVAGAACVVALASRVLLVAASSLIGYSRWPRGPLTISLTIWTAFAIATTVIWLRGVVVASSIFRSFER